MAAPPLKPKPDTPPEGLAEVERALSVLQGRHPEHERLRREDEEKRAKRKAEIDATASIEGRRISARRARVGAIAAALLVIAVTAVLVVRYETARRARVDRAVEPYRVMGFSVFDTSDRRDPSLEANVPAGCLLAASMSGSSASIRVDYGGSITEGPGPVITCICQGGRVAVTSDASAREDGLVLMHADASALGGSRAFAFLPLRHATTGRTDQPCAEASLDAWLDAKRWVDAPPAAELRPSAPVDRAASEAWLAADPRRAALARVGFEVVATVSPNAPFAIVDVPAATCALLVPERPADGPSLRVKGGALAVGPAAGNVAWCTSSEARLLAQREARRGGDGASAGGEIAVLLAPAARAGGLFGTAEIAASAGLPLAAASLPPADRGWSAKQLLVASAIPESLVSVANAPELGADPDARIVALSLEGSNGLAAESPAEVFSFCDPPLDGSSASLCIFSGPQSWHVGGADVVGGIARAKLPFWLFALKDVSEPVALKLQAELVALARRLRRDGFEPTTIGAVTELDDGAEVLGRAHEDAMIVVGLAPAAPWVFPYTDGPAWTIDGEPRVVPIAPLQRVKVRSTIKPLPSKATRRTVVFRRRSDGLR